MLLAARHQRLLALFIACAALGFGFQQLRGPRPELTTDTSHYFSIDNPAEWEAGREMLRMHGPRLVAELHRQYGSLRSDSEVLARLNADENELLDEYMTGLAQFMKRIESIEACLSADYSSLDLEAFLALRESQGPAFASADESWPVMVTVAHTRQHTAIKLCDWKDTLPTHRFGYGPLAQLKESIWQRYFALHTSE